MLENKLNKLKYKRILDDLLENLKKTNDQIGQNSKLEFFEIFLIKYSFRNIY